MNHKIKELQKMINSALLPEYTEGNEQLESLIALHNKVKQCIQETIDINKNKKTWSDTDLLALSTLKDTVNVFLVGSHNLKQRIRNSADE